MAQFFELDLNEICRAKAVSSADSRHRTYSLSKVIHERRGVLAFYTPQPIVNNFGGMHFLVWEQFLFWLNRKVGRAGFGRRITHSNVVTFIWRCSLRSLRSAVKERSEPFARKSFSLGGDEPYKSFHPAEPARLATNINWNEGSYEYLGV